MILHHPTATPKFLCDFECTAPNGTQLELRTGGDRGAHYKHNCDVRRALSATGYDASSDTATATLPCLQGCMNPDGSPRLFHTAAAQSLHQQHCSLNRTATTAAAPAPTPPPANNDDSESEEEDEPILEELEQEAEETYREELMRKTLGTHSRIHLETVKHMMSCPHLHEQRTRHATDFLFAEYKEKYFFSLPFLYFMMNCVGHHIDGRETHQHGTEIKRLADKAAAMTAASTLASLTTVTAASTLASITSANSTNFSNFLSNTNQHNDNDYECDNDDYLFGDDADPF
eukprot:GDKJ01041846.1.p1 GENE.GDKJ01041846.1~~GDKJ01041846.1.p1  ORF type:complete len:288 (+),score=25.31 GDKJ01041846.1:160-1023(+)